MELKPKISSETLPDIEQFLVAAIGVLLIGALYLVMPERLTLGPKWVLIVVEAILLAPTLLLPLLLRRTLPFAIVRSLTLGLLAIITIALIGSVALLLGGLSKLSKGAALLEPAALLWIINVLVFAFWYWETDGGGPVKRRKAGFQAADFEFPQQKDGDPGNWCPGFIDYVFLAFCTSTALSPADTNPLSRRAKGLMMVQASIALVVLVVLIGRSVNIF